MIKNFTLFLILLLTKITLYPQCAASLTKAEDAWRNRNFADAFNELLAARNCQDQGIARMANNKILEYANQFQRLYRDRDNVIAGLRRTQDSLIATKSKLDAQIITANEAVERSNQLANTAQESKKKAVDANQNFYNGLTIFIDYITTVNQLKDFAAWASSKSKIDNLNNVLSLMIDNSPTIQKQGPGEISRWKNSLAQLKTEDMAQLFVILGKETLVTKEKEASELYQDKINEARAFLTNNAPDLALNILLPLEATTKDVPLYEVIVSCYRKFKMRDSAEHFAQKMYELRPNASNVLLTMRMVKADKRDFHSAEYFAKRVIDAKRFENEPIKASDYANLSYYQLFSRDYEQALLSADEAYKIENLNWILVNKAHALFLLNRKEEAFQLYRFLKDKPDDTSNGIETLKKSIIADLDEMESRGLGNPDFKQVRALLF